MMSIIYLFNIPWLRPIYYRLVKWYFRKPRQVVMNNITMQLNPTVFHPGLYMSTDVLLDFICTKDIEQKAVCELGAGSGYISLYLAKHKGCRVTAIDINESALAGLRSSASLNDVEIDIRYSNLFESIQEKQFDYILVNPPFYKGTPKTKDGFAFYAGERLEYFTDFFSQVNRYIHQGCKVYMILSDNAPVDTIKKMALDADLQLIVVFEKIEKSETLVIFNVTNSEIPK